MKKDPTVNVHIFLQHVRQWLTPKPRMGRSKAKHAAVKSAPSLPETPFLSSAAASSSRSMSTETNMQHGLQSGPLSFCGPNLSFSRLSRTSDRRSPPCTPVARSTPAARSSFSEPSYLYPLAAPAVLISTWVIWEDGPAVEKNSPPGWPQSIVLIWCGGPSSLCCRSRGSKLAG